MARTAKAKLDTRAARLRLTPRTKPYAVTVAPRRVLGYVRVQTGAGRWVAVVEVGRGPTGAALRRQGFLALADDLAKADGAGVLAFADALSAAANWQPGGGGGKLKVRKAIEDYVAGKRAAAGDDPADDAWGTLRLHVLREDEDGRPLPGAKGLGETAVADLTLTDLREWRDALVDGRSRSRVNRIVKTLKAALNHAFDDEESGIKSDSAWRRLELFKNADTRREDHFSEPEVARLIREARKQDAAFADLLTAAFHTGARYGEIAALDVRHFDARLRTLAIPSGKTGARIVTLTEEGAAWFAEIAGDRPPREALLRPLSGERWGKSWQHQRMKAALRAAGLPASAVFYTLRHSYISRAIERGMPLSVLAENCGTSVKMIEENYAKHIAQKRRAMIERTGPRLRVVRRA